MTHCRHDNQGWPQGGYQRCNDCGARRRYSFDLLLPGKWEAPELPDGSIAVPESRLYVWLLQRLHIVKS